MHRFNHAVNLLKDKVFAELRATAMFLPNKMFTLYPSTVALVIVAAAQLGVDGHRRW